MRTLLVLSHLRWDETLHRAQQLLARLARQYRVVFVEPPTRAVGPAGLARSEPHDRVLVVRTHAPQEGKGFDDAPFELLAPALRALIAGEAGDDELTAWLTTPDAWPFASTLGARVVVYDCMDERWLPRSLSAQRRERERALLKCAHVVFAGGPCLYGARRRRHPNVHCVPSPLDAAHFAPERVTARAEEYLAAERLQAHVLAPRLGFFGLIDERIDLALVADMAHARPDWHVIMVGPVARRGMPLPRLPNIHWLGEQPYRRLPALVAGWDVCLLPLARSEQSPFAGPAMALEYLAAEKPVVSTAVADVAGPFGRVVRVAPDRAGFLRSCEDALHESPGQRAQRLEHAMAFVSRFSWDDAAQAVLQVLAEARRRGNASPMPSLRDACKALLPVVPPRAVPPPVPLPLPLQDP